MAPPHSSPGGVTASTSASSRAPVTNQGTIFATSKSGVFLHAGGTVSNNGTAAGIAGGQFGVYIDNGKGAVMNQGTIAGTSTHGAS